MSAYEYLLAAVGPHILHYRNDLLKHDRNAIEFHGDDCPFLNWARPNGTDMVHLVPADSTNWPAHGELVPWLFGTANRETILRSALDHARYNLKQMENNTPRLAHYWTGRTLRRITNQRAVELAQDYTHRTMTEWRRESRVT